MAITLKIDHKTVHANPGQTILEVARENNIKIPTICYHPDLSVVGSCRLCMVEIEGWNGEQAACTTLASDGMVVVIESPSLRESRKFILEMLLWNYYDSGYSGGSGEKETEFDVLVKDYQAFGLSDPQLKCDVDSDPNPFVWVDMNKCILCTRCVRACEEIQGRFVWGVANRGSSARVVPGVDTTLLEARCEFCGACVAYCPTGALDKRMSIGKGIPERVVTTTCTYCGVGCQLNLNISDNMIIGVTTTPKSEPNGMHLCVKGRFGYDFVHHPDRLKQPMVRQYLLNSLPRPVNDRGKWVETDWDTALGIVAEKIFNVKQRFGPDAIGVLTSAKCTNEENYLMQKFARQVVGTHNVDHCARL